MKETKKRFHEVTKNENELQHEPIVEVLNELKGSFGEYEFVMIYHKDLTEFFLG